MTKHLLWLLPLLGLLAVAFGRDRQPEKTPYQVGRYVGPAVDPWWRPL
jgi:hypothetical protein